MSVEDERQREARGVAREWVNWPEVEVAVVVFVRSRGADAADAQDRAVDAVWSQLLAKDNGHLPTRQRGIRVPDVTMNVVGATEIGRAATNGMLRLTPIGRAFR